MSLAQELAEHVKDNLLQYVGQRVIASDDGKCYDYYHELAEKIVPSHLQWVSGMVLDNRDTVTLEKVVVDRHEGTGVYRVICLISSDCGQAYLYGHDGIQLIQEEELS